MGLMQVVGREGSMVVCAAWGGTFRDRRNSDRCGSELQENTHMSKVEEKGQKLQYLINKWITQNKTIGGGMS